MKSTINDNGLALIGNVNRGVAAADMTRIRVMSYNVALLRNNVGGDEHYDSNGYYIGGIIQTEATYNERNAAWRKLMNDVSPDVFVTIEHNDGDRFATYGGTRYTRDTIFSQFGNMFLRGSGNYAKCVFSRLGAFDAEEHTFDVDPERNYIIADIEVGGVLVRFAVAHLLITRPIDGADAMTAKRRAEMEKLIELCDDYDHAVILGDFNILNASEYNLFTDEGYEVANHGYLGNMDTYSGSLVISTGSRALDNICAKGFNVSNIHVEDAAIYRDINGVRTRYPLSDHNPIWCDLTMKP